MATYAYRWADGSVSVCSAEDIGEASSFFDEFGPVSRKLIIELNSPLMVTLRPDIRQRWKLAEDGSQLGEEIGMELPEKCYPRYDAAFWKAVEENQNDPAFVRQSPKLRRRIRRALAADVEEAKERIKKTPDTLDLLLVYPNGLPGQNN